MLLKPNLTINHPLLVAPIEIKAIKSDFEKSPKRKDSFTSGGGGDIFSFYQPSIAKPKANIHSD